MYFLFYSLSRSEIFQSVSENFHQDRFIVCQLRWGYPIELNRSHNFISKNAYRNVNRLLLTIYNNKQMQIDLEKSSRYFPSIETLTIRFEQSVSSYLMGLYINQLMNVNSIKHLVLNERGHTISTLAELLQRTFHSFVLVRT